VHEFVKAPYMDVDCKLGISRTMLVCFYGVCGVRGLCGVWVCGCVGVREVWRGGGDVRETDE